MFGGGRVHAENQVEYGFEYYKEDGDRMTIETHSVYFEQKLTDYLDIKGDYTYDGISGSTPTGTVSSSGKVYMTQLEDIRRAISLQADAKLGNHTLTPGFSYSAESDYTSYGMSLNDAVEFNDKNTTLQYGIAENIDSVREANGKTWNPKYSTTALIGISQLLSAKTTFNAAFTFGNDSGYLSDPYRLAGFTPDGFPFSIGVPERRPSHRNKEILYTSMLHYFDPLNASLEGSYRFYHDSYGVYANTLGLTGISGSANICSSNRCSASMNSPRRIFTPSLSQGLSPSTQMDRPACIPPTTGSQNSILWTRVCRSRG